MTDIMSLKDELLQIQQKADELEKRKAELESIVSAEEAMADWKSLTKVKEQCLQLLQDSGLSKYVKTLSDLEDFPSHYEYQHPETKYLRTNSLDQSWVQQYIGDMPMGRLRGESGNPEGTKKGRAEAIQVLESTAQKSRMRVWRQAVNKRRRAGSKSKDDNSDTYDMGDDGKDVAIKNLGVG